tara:strand:+ start:129 stop:305 length:177 start_codon:yes stop_codon:yes gene_type:complete
MVKRNQIKNTLELSVSNRSIQNAFYKNWVNQNKPTEAQKLGNLLTKSYELTIQRGLNN